MRSYQGRSCLYVILFSLLAGALLAAGQKTPVKHTKAKVLTNRGTFVIELYDKEMPITVANFKSLVKQKFFNGLKFHRVEDWVIQTGDPTGTGQGGSKKTIKLETNPKCTHVEGAVGMARNPNPNSASSQWYVVKEAKHVLDGRYACFGKVIQGMKVVKQIKQGDKVTSITLL